MASMSESSLALQVRTLSKTFSGRRILHDISFDVKLGEIHALVGENGCGKSTFIKCLSGFHAPDDGADIKVHGQTLAIPFTPAQSSRAGFGFVHQNLGLIDDLTVLENLALSRGFALGRLGNIDWKAERGRARRALDVIGAEIDPNAYLRDLSLAERTLVAIARGLQIGVSQRVSPILVLDEPTAALPQEEVERLFKALNSMVQLGVSIIYVSHRLNEILRLADRVTAIRNGRRVDTRPKQGLREQDLVQMIVGRSVTSHYPDVTSRTRSCAIVVEARKLCGRRIHEVDLSIREGEIVGIAGLLGAGRSEIGRIIFGAQHRTSGRLLVSGREVTFQGPADGLANGIGYVPQDRLGQGGFKRLPVSENLTIADLSEFWRTFRLDQKKEQSAVLNFISGFDVRPKNAAARFGSLSGGNQQKVIIGRMLRLKLKLLILGEPVQGVDIGSKSAIYRMIEGAAQDGMGILLIDSDFENLCKLCHRVLIVTQGRVITEVSGANTTSDRVTELVYLSGSAH